MENSLKTNEFLHITLTLGNLHNHPSFNSLLAVAVYVDMATTEASCYFHL